MQKLLIGIFIATACTLQADTIEDLQALKSGMMHSPKGCQQIADGYGWTIMHNPSPELMEKLLKPMQEISNVLRGSSECQADFVKNNGITKFRKLLRENLNSNDSGCEALSALFLAGIDDKDSIPQIARLLDIDRSQEKTSSNNTNIHRAAAAVSLAMLNAAGPYEAKIAAMLKGPSDYDVRGAIQAIQIMNWRKYVPELGQMLSLPEATPGNHHKKKHKKAKAVDQKARENAIAKANWAIQALGSMKAKEYSSKITPFLKLSEVNYKNHVVIALAEMEAVDSADALAEFYRDPKQFDIMAKNEIPIILALFKAQNHKDIIIDALKNGQDKNQAIAVLALLGDERDVPTLEKALENPETGIGAAVGLMYLERKEYYNKIYDVLTPYLAKKDFSRVNKKDLTPFFRLRFGLTTENISQLDSAAAKVNRVWREIVASREK